MSEEIEAVAAEPAAPEVVPAPEPAQEGIPAVDAPVDPDAELGAIYDRLNSSDQGSEGGPAEEIADQPNVEGAEPEVLPAINAPDAWSAEIREKWASLPRDVQEYVAKREKDAHSRISQMGQELSQYKPLAELRTKTLDVFDRHGMTPEQGFERLVYAQQVLDQNPLQGLAAIAQSYGIDLAKAFGGQQAQQPNDPRFAALQSELEQARAILTNQQRDQTAAQMRAERDAEAWAAKTVEEWVVGKEHFDLVREDMQKLLSAGVAENLDEAYETAILRNPELREKVEAAKRAEADKKAQEERERAAKEAKRAAKVNTGNKPAIPKPKGKWDNDDWLSSAYDAVTAG